MSRPFWIVTIASALMILPTRPEGLPAQSASQTCSAVDDCLVNWACLLPPAVPQIGGSATLAPGRLITDDGKGPFADGRDSANVYVRAALNIHPTLARVDAAQARRFFRIDLTRPADSTAMPLGVIEDPFADLHAWGSTLARNKIEPTVQYQRVGTTVKSAATHWDFHYNGRYYLLQLGPEAVGTGCNEGGTAVYGTGTTQATVSRPQHNAYIVDAPDGSVARLFDITNKFAGAVNKGLYYVSFRAAFEFP